MPTETIVLYMAGKLATSQAKATYPEYCEQHGLDPVRAIFLPSEVHQLDRLNDPPQTKSLSGRSPEL
jgi:hypothetical protein